MLAGYIQKSNSPQRRYGRQDFRSNKKGAPQPWSTDSNYVEELAASRYFEFTAMIKKHSTQELNKQADMIAFIKSLEADWQDKHSEDGPSSDFNLEKAQDLIGHEGYWGVANTAARLAESIVKGAGEDLEKLRAGRAGISRGFQQAEKNWGSKLPEISYQTLAATLAVIDEKIRSLDSTVIDAVA